MGESCSMVDRQGEYWPMLRASAVKTGKAELGRSRLNVLDFGEDMDVKVVYLAGYTLEEGVVWRGIVESAQMVL